MIDPSQSLEEKGFAIVVGCLTEQMVNRLCAHLSDDQHAQRNLPDVPMVRELAASKAVKPIIDCLLGKESFAVRGILFNKNSRCQLESCVASGPDDCGSGAKERGGFWSVVDQGRGSARTTSGIPHVQDDRHPVALGRESGKQRSTARHPWLTPRWLSLKCGH